MIWRERKERTTLMRERRESVQKQVQLAHLGEQASKLKLDLMEVCIQWKQSTYNISIALIADSLLYACAIFMYDLWTPRNKNSAWHGGVGTRLKYYL